jgi:Ca2+-transporting ATPase
MNKQINMAEPLDVVVGLTEIQVKESRKLNGSNDMELVEDRVIWHVIKDVVTEPMFLLLFGSCLIYFVLGEFKEAFILLISLFLVAGISIFQEYRSKNAIKALKKITSTGAKVFRNGMDITIPSEEVVVNDLVIVEEGNLIPADGVLFKSNDFEVNESTLTGESFAVAKSHIHPDSVYGGTLVVSGSAIIKIVSVGVNTQFGKIGKSIQNVKTERTSLQQQIRTFVRNMVWIGSIAFIIVIGFNYYLSHDFVHSLLQGFTLAMSILPEEIPVAFSTFQALGAFRLLKNNKIIVKQPGFVETLGSATVICADKTGTITKNEMTLVEIYEEVTQQTTICKKTESIPFSVIEMAMWSSESEPFDPMEKAIHNLYAAHAQVDQRKNFKQIHEYPLAGKPPMMTHIFSDDKSNTIIAVKGAPEAILSCSRSTEKRKVEILLKAKELASKGLRVLGVGKANASEYQQWPSHQTEFTFEFLGLIGFQDPPKPNIAETIKKCNEAGIDFKMITGDYAETALAIAHQIDLNTNNEVLTGVQVMEMSENELCGKVKQTQIFARMFPDAKLKVVEALKKNGEVVAMTGDGVNDGPALKAAHISIAMGQSGSELAKSTASLILTDDDLFHMTDAVAMGRKIYDNLKKAIRYIISIHIPIIGIVALPLLLFWPMTAFFSPIHVIFLELIMGPTCSIVFENEPMEPGTMKRKPLPKSSSFLSLNQLTLSIIQGVFITAGCLGLGFYMMKQGGDITFVRTCIFMTLLLSNVFLTLVNRSFTLSLWESFKNKNKLVPIAILFSIVFMILSLQIPFVRSLFGLISLNKWDWIICTSVALICTCWLEGYKFYIRRNSTG